LAVERQVCAGQAAGPLSKLVSGDPSRVTAAVVAQAAGFDDPEAREILVGATEAMAWALAHVVTLLNPRRIILGGGVSLMGDALWFEPIRQRLRERVFPPFRDSFDLVPPRLGEEVVVHGALALARDAVAGSGESEIENLPYSRTASRHDEPRGA
jgi:glucokinase